jgi:CheY-like chemotaxis protein
MADRIKIMIVDDNPANLKLAGDLLEGEGFDICRCINAKATLDALHTFHPALILMDISLPVMDGLQLTQKIKSDERNNDIRIVALTASAMKGDKERILAAGCDGYIAKPIDTRKFKEQISPFLPMEP